MEKLELLKEIATKFNQENITWNLGASCMLYLRGVVTKFDDLDIMVSKQDIIKVQDIMKEYGSPTIRVPNEKYKTKVFLEYNIKGIEIDIMSEFIIVNDGIDYAFDLSETDPYDAFELDGVIIRLAPISEWYQYYKLMNRTDKVELLKDIVEKSE